MQCKIKILRKLDDGQSEMKIGQAIFKATNGIVELSQLELGTGLKGNLNRLTEDAELYLSKDGAIIGRISMFTMFGNDRVDVLRFESNFTPKVGGYGPEGRNSYQIRSGLDVAIVVENCVEN